MCKSYLLLQSTYIQEIVNEQISSTQSTLEDSSSEIDEDFIIKEMQKQIHLQQNVLHSIIKIGLVIGYGKLKTSFSIL